MPDWNDADRFRNADRFLMGEAWIGSRIASHIGQLCDTIGVRWAGTHAERLAAEYVAKQFRECALDNPRTEAFDLRSWECQQASIGLTQFDEQSFDARACLFCPPINVTGRFVDVGFGMSHELATVPGDRLRGAIVLIDAGFEPFSDPVTFNLRLRSLAQAGVVAAITPYVQGGRRTADFSVTDWRDDDLCRVPLPVVQTSREDGARLRRCYDLDSRVAVIVESTFPNGTSWNAVGELAGSEWPDESLAVSAHHDTTTDSFGANDNASGVAVLLETARLLTQLQRDTGTAPGRTIRFVSFGAEEQGLQGSTAFVRKHHGPDTPPRLMVNLDELAAGPMKGVVLQFPELRSLVQTQLAAMNEGLACHVLAQLDASGDMFPFARAGIPAAILWRWRFVGRHPDVAYGHSSADTPDKVRIRELKEYAGYLARLLLRLSHVPPDDWPATRQDVYQIAQRIEAERGTVFRTM